MANLAYPTREVRWFLRGKVQSEIWQWFQQGAAEAEAIREDWYFSLPKQPDLSIKLRQGKIEIKQRTAKEGIQKLAKGIKGQVEQWEKWSFPLDEAKPLDIAASGAWILVKKERLSQRYVLGAGKKVVKVIEPSHNSQNQNSQSQNSQNEQPDQGCTIELAELWVNNQPWYSFGFEAFGQQDTLAETLEQVARQVLADPTFPSMKAKHSFGYPQWLRHLQDRA